MIFEVHSIGRSNGCFGFECFEAGSGPRMDFFAGVVGVLGLIAAGIEESVIYENYQCLLGAEVIRESF